MIRSQITLSDAGVPLPARWPRSGVVVIGTRALPCSPHNMPTAQASAFRYSPHTQELHGHALAPVNAGGAMFHPAASAACLAGPYSSVNSLLGQLHAERVAAGVRPHTHAHIAASFTSSILPPRASPRLSRSTRGLQPASRSPVWQARASLGTKGMRKKTRCSRQTPTVMHFSGRQGAGTLSLSVSLLLLLGWHPTVSTR